MAQCYGYRFRMKIQWMLGKFDAIQSNFLMDIESNEATNSKVKQKRKQQDSKVDKCDLLRNVFIKYPELSLAYCLKRLIPSLQW